MVPSIQRGRSWGHADADTTWECEQSDYFLSFLSFLSKTTPVAWAVRFARILLNAFSNAFAALVYELSFE